MNTKQIAQTIAKEFNVPCGVHGDYYLWNAPIGVYDAELRDFRERVHQRIVELEVQEEAEQQKG